MIDFRQAWLAALALYLSAPLALAQAPVRPAGDAVARVLALAGTATVERGGAVRTLAHGDELSPGDVLNVGEASVLQLRFTDETLLSLRANSRLRIDEFRFTGQPAQDRSLLELLRGGMRTVTGLIGKANPRAVAVRSYAATIGIRGTHFSLVACADDCVEPDGTRPANGVFGGVTDGRIAVGNRAGETEFGQQDYFFVAGPDAPPERLLAPPGVLSERVFVTRARAAAAQARADAGLATRAARVGSTEASTSPQLAAQRLPAALVATLRENLSASERPAVVEALTTATGAVTFLRVQADAGAAATTARSLSLADLRAAVPEVGDLTFYNAATFAAQLSRFTTVEARPAAAAYWTWTAPAANASLTDRLGTHTIWGDTPRAAALPTSGIVTYGFAGGTTPTDNLGRQGQFTAGQLAVDFASGKVQALDVIGMRFQAQGVVPAVAYAVPAGSAWSLSGGSIASVACEGCHNPQATITGRLVGAAVQGYVAGITVQSQIGANAAVRHTGGTVAAFGR